MASLSNINGLFDVHSTGAILFSTSHGTSGQILRSNGNAAPTWVAASTVIGGPYLPLTGGTLTGPLSGTSATFAGSVTANGGINGLTLANGGISGSNYNIAGVNQLTIADPGEGIVFTGTTTLTLAVIDDTVDDKLKLTNATQLDLNSTARITNLLDPSSAQDAATKAYVDSVTPGAGPFLPLTGGTLTGNLNLTANKYILIGTDSGDAFNANSAIRIQDSSHAYVQMKVGNSSQGGVLIGNTTDDYLGGFTYSNSSESLIFKTANTDALTITGAGNATFAGNVVLDTSSARLRIKSGATGTNGGIDWTYNTASTQYARIDLNYDTRASVGLLIDSGYPITLDFSSGRFAIQHNGSEKMRIDSSGNVGINTTVFPSSGFAKLVVAGGAIAARPSGVNDYFSYIKSNWALENAFEIGIEGAGTQHRLITSGNYYYGTELRFWTSDTQRVTINSVGNFGIGTTSPDSKLHVESTSATGANFILETTHSGGIPLLDLKGAASAQLRYKDELNVIQSRIDFGDSGTFNFIDVPNNNSTLYLKTGGNVGIGTTSPLALLNIEGPNNQDGNDYAQLYIKGTGTYPDDIAGVVLDSAGSHQSHIRFSNNGSPKFQLRYNEGGNTIDRLTFYSFTQGNDMMTLDGATGNVGIGTTTPYNRLHSSGVLGIGTANQTPGLTSTMSGGGGGAQYAGGSIYVIQGYAGVMSSGDTFTFIYEATDWKAWSAEFVFTSTSGMSRGAEGGYNNNGSGHSSEMGTNALGCTASTTNVGQHVKIVFSFTNPGTHPMAKITYSQSGGDGVPRADRVNINWNT